MAILTKPLGTLLGFFYPNMLIDVAHAYKKSEQLYKGTWNITLIFQGRIQLAHPKAEGEKTKSSKCSKQLWSRQLSFYKFFSTAILMKLQESK